MTYLLVGRVGDVLAVWVSSMLNAHGSRVANDNNKTCEGLLTGKKITHVQAPSCNYAVGRIEEVPQRLSSDKATACVTRDIKSQSCLSIALLEFSG